MEPCSAIAIGSALMAEPMDDSDILAPEPPASEVLEAQIKALENQIAHLVRSNAEME